MLGERNWLSAAGVVARSSAGASEALPVFAGDPLEALKALKAKGYRIVTAGIRDSVSLYEANLKKPLPVASGERGIRQSDAVFSHIKNLPVICEELRDELCDYIPVGVGVSTRPRSVTGSYMPCFLSGIAVAHAFAVGAGVNVSEFSHQDGHVMAALYSSGQTERLLASDFLAFHVSGGTTELLLAHPNGDTFDLTLVGETADINAGQLIDRVGVMMGLDFPCGAALEVLATEGGFEKQRVKSVVRESDGVVRCNLSGIENISKRMLDAGKEKSEVAAYVFASVCDTLSRMAEAAIGKYGEMPVLFSGGVMSNRLMRDKLSSRFDASFAEPQFSADNAAGIALLCRNKNMKK